MTGDSPPNTTIEYADRLLEEFHRGKKAASVKAGHFGVVVRFENVLSILFV